MGNFSVGGKCKCVYFGEIASGGKNIVGVGAFHFVRIDAGMPSFGHQIGVHVQMRTVERTVSAGSVQNAGRTVCVAVDQNTRRLDRVVGMATERKIAIDAQIVQIGRGTVRVECGRFGHVVHRNRLTTRLQLQTRRTMWVADRLVKVVLHRILFHRVRAQSFQLELVALTFVNVIQHLLKKLGQHIELKSEIKNK